MSDVQEIDQNFTDYDSLTDTRKRQMYDDIVKLLNRYDIENA